MNQDSHIIDVLKKRRGRKKFILIDDSVKGRLKKRDVKYLDKVKHISPYESPEKVEDDLPDPLSEDEEKDLLD